MRTLPKPRSLFESADAADRVFVAVALLAAIVGLFVYIALFARDMPYWDDWDLVPVLARVQPFDLSWVVNQTLEHRYVLAKLLIYPIFLATGDFRSTIWIDAVILALLAVAYVAAARRLRGRVSFVDAFFPLLLLHWAHGENLIFFVQLCFIVPAALFSAIVILVATDRWRSSRAIVAIAICIALMPLNGAIGLLYAIPLIAWAFYAAWRQRKRKELAWPLWFSAIAAAIFTALYFLHYIPSPLARREHTVAGTLRTTFELLSTIFGMPGMVLSPWLGIGVALLCVGAAVMLIRVITSRAEERVRASGLLFALASVGLMVLGIAYGRSVVGVGAGFASRYALIAVPAIAVVFFAVQLYANDFTRRLVGLALFAATCAMFAPNIRIGLDYAANRDKVADAVASDIAAGLPFLQIAQRNPGVYPEAEKFGRLLEALQREHVGPYRNAPTPAAAMKCSAQTIAIPVASMNQVTVEGDLDHGVGDDPFVVYELPHAMRVCGVRIEYDLDNRSNTPPMTQLFWKLASAGEEFDGHQRNTVVTSKNGSQTTTFWIYGAIDHFRFDPDNRSCTFRVRNITLLAEDPS